jgi:hypothetical protein
MAQAQLDQSNGTEIPFWRRESFYSPETSVFFNGISMKKHFDDDRGQYYVHWMKDNRPQGSVTTCYGNSHQRVSASELPLLIAILQKLISEIDSTSYRETLPRFKNNEFANIMDRCDANYWDPSLAERLPSESLLVRQVRLKDGAWSIKLLAPRTSQVNSSWNGISVNLTLGVARAFLNKLKYFQDEIDAEVGVDTVN